MKQKYKYIIKTDSSSETHEALNLAMICIRKYLSVYPGETITIIPIIIEDYIGRKKK